MSVSFFMGNSEETIIKHKTATAEYWMDENDILHSRLDKNARVDEDNARENIAVRNCIRPNYRVGVMLDLGSVFSVNYEARKLTQKHATLDKYYAVAILAQNTIARLIGSMALGMNSVEVPTKVFSDEKKAYEWLLEMKNHDAE